MPSIAALLNQYKDRTGASYDDISRMLGGSLSRGRLQQIMVKGPDAFPRPETVPALASLLHMSVTAILEAYAVGLGMDVEQRQSILSMSLPPGTDVLTDRDRMAILAVIRQLVDARRAADEADPDLSRVDKLRVAEPEQSQAPANSQTNK